MHEDSNIAARLHQERQLILAELKEKENDEEFKMAKQERVRYIQSLLQEVEEDSLRTSAENHLISEDELNQLIKVSN